MNKKEQFTQLINSINIINSITILGKDSESVSNLKQIIANVCNQIQNEMQQEQEAKQKQPQSKEQK